MARLKINPASSAKLSINPLLGHDLDLNATYYARATSSATHDITTEDISISAWVKVDVDATASYTYEFIRKSTQSGNYEHYEFYWDGMSRALFIYVKDSNNDNYYVRANYALNDNKWHHVVGIIDRDTVGNCKIFIDGINGTTYQVGSLALIDSLTNSGIMGIGADGSGGFWRLDGQIRDVKLYYANGDHWTDEQILYQAQHPFDYSANAGTLTDYWRCDEGSGLTVNGLVNDLTLSNALAWSTQPKVKISPGL